MICEVSGCYLDANFSCSCLSKLFPICLNHAYFHLSEAPCLNHRLTWLVYFSDKVEEITKKIDQLNLQIAKILKQAAEDKQTLLDLLENEKSIYQSLLQKKSIPLLNQLYIKTEKPEEISYFKYFDWKYWNSIVTQSLFSEFPENNSIYIPDKTFSLYISHFNFCKLPGKKIFCYVNARNVFHPELCFIVDQFNNVEIAGECQFLLYAGSVYYNGFVYIFGFSDKNILVRYDLKRKKWRLLCCTDRFGYFNTCDILGTKLLYIEYKNGILAYDAFSNSNSLSLKLEINSTMHHFIFCTKNRAYIVISGGKVYESSINDPYSWTVFSEISRLKSKEILSYPMVYKNHFVLLFKDKSVYNFFLGKKVGSF